MLFKKSPTKTKANFGLTMVSKAPGLYVKQNDLLSLIVNLCLACTFLLKSPVIRAQENRTQENRTQENRKGASKKSSSLNRSQSPKVQMTFPATPENVKYLLKYSLHWKKYRLTSRKASMEVPLKAKILQLTAVRADGTIAREYSVVPLNKQLKRPPSQANPARGQQSSPEELDAKILSSYESTASHSELSSTKKIAEEEQNEIRRTDLEARIGLKLIRFDLNSTLGTQSLKGSSLLLSPTYELAQSFASHQTKWAVGLGGTFAKLELKQASQNANGMFSKTYLFTSIQLAPQFTVRGSLNVLKTPELAEVIRDVDDSEQANLSSYLRVSPAIRAEYNPVDPLELGLELKPFVSGGGGYGYALEGAYRMVLWRKIRGYLGADYDIYKLQRRGQCSACTNENTTIISKLSLNFQGRMAF